MTGKPRRLVVVGGGISGLAAAWEAVTGGEVDVTVIEADDRLGGRIHTSVVHDLRVDEGADAFLARVPWAVDLCRELDLDDSLVSPAARDAFLYSRGDLRPLPSTQVFGVPLDLEELADNSIVSPEGLAEARRTVATAGPETSDDTIAAVLHRQVGAEVADRLVDPLIGGINAGDTTKLSLRAVVPQLATAAEHRDGMVAGLRAMRTANPPDPDAPIFFGLPDGTETLIATLSQRLADAGATILTGHRVADLTRTADGSLRLDLNASDGQATVEADGVVLATPAPVTADLVGAVAPDSAEALNSIEHASVALITFVVADDQVDRPLDGSGFLVPRPEGLHLTACSWASSKWAHIGGDGCAVLRASVGRAGSATALDLDDDALVDLVRQDLATTMELSGEPLAVRMSRFPESFPQYAPGHLDLVDRLEADLAAQLPGVAVAGWSYRGIGIPACIQGGRQAVRTVLG